MDKHTSRYDIHKFLFVCMCSDVASSIITSATTGVIVSCSTVSTSDSGGLQSIATRGRTVNNISSAVTPTNIRDVSTNGSSKSISWSSSIRTSAGFTSAVCDPADGIASSSTATSCVG